MTTFRTATRQATAVVQAVDRSDRQMLLAQGWNRRAAQLLYPDEPDLYDVLGLQGWNRWPRNAGPRLDHFLISKQEPRPQSVKAGVLHRRGAGEEGASDHALVWIESLALDGAAR